jgi:hypothetical protein
MCLRADGGRPRHNGVSDADDVRAAGVISTAMLRADGLLQLRGRLHSPKHRF